MKKYKLIKSYPGSVNLGVKLERCQIPTRILNDNLFNRFWEEVVEKDYEILSITDCNNIHIKLSNGNFKYGISTISEDFINEYPIHSVKRLSDGEVFTVGDKVSDKMIIWKNCNIREFIINENNLIVSIKQQELHGNYALNCIKHIKKPLFTTEDGVDIFKGDKTCWINSWIVTNFTDWKRTMFLELNEKHFSTIEKANEYILMNKPCLSINDISKFYTSAKNGLSNNSKQLIELVKTKV
jgi:hypothetical protein